MVANGLKYSPLLMITFYALYFQLVQADPGSYQPDVSAPQLTRKDNQTIELITKVIDKFGKINNATLSYSHYYGNNSEYQGRKEFWETIPMKLSWGDHHNGTYSGTIEIPGDIEPLYLTYNLTFADDLGYENSTLGSYTLHNSSDDTEAPKVESSPHVPRPENYDEHSKGNYIVRIDNDTTILAQLSDTGSGIKKATMYYGKNLEQSTTMEPIDPSSIWRGEWAGLLSTDGIKADTTVKYKINVCDFAGNCTCNGPYEYKTEDVKLNTTDVQVSILDANPSNLTTVLQPSIIDHSWPKEKALEYQAIVIGNNNNYSRFDWEPFQNPTWKVDMVGDTSDYPFDYYNTTLIVAIPNNTATTIKDTNTTISQSSKLNWNISSNVSNIAPSSVAYLCNTNSTKDSLVCPTDSRHNQTTFVKFELLFNRNFTISGITVPILGIFFLLGAILIFESESGLDTRLVLSLTIFALIFSLPEIIKSLKPEITLGPTIADALVSVIVMATIAYTVGSVIGAKLSEGRWQKWLDVIAFIFVAVIVVVFLYNHEYSIVNKLLVGSISIFGLGYGLLFQWFIVPKIPKEAK